jgi:DNA-binding NtrC family response regulator
MPDRLPVLIVEDQPAVAKALSVLLDVHDLPHRLASSPAEALAIAAREPLAAAVQDMNFTPGETSGIAGVELFHRLRERDPALPVFLLTAWASLETAVELVRRGAADYVQKPWDDARLVAALAAVVDARSAAAAAARERQELARSRADMVAAHDLRGLG